MNRNVALALVGVVIIATVVVILHQLKRPENEAATASSWHDQPEHHHQRVDMSPGEIVWYSVKWNNIHRMRVSFKSGGPLNFGVLPGDAEPLLRSDASWFGAHLDQASCVHMNLTEGTFDCVVANPPILIVFGDPRDGTSEDQKQIQVDMDAYNCTVGCPTLPPQ